MPFGLGFGELVVILLVLLVGFALFAGVVTIIVRTVMRFEDERRGGAGRGDVRDD